MVWSMSVEFGSSEVQALQQFPILKQSWSFSIWNKHDISEAVNSFIIELQ